MNSDRAAIIGTNPISASIALALREQKTPIELVGYDARRPVADLAKARGIFDEVRRKPGAACRGANLVIVSEPLVDIEETFAAISADLEPGTLVTDTARLKAPVMRWAESLLPSRVSFVGGHPIPNPAVVGLEPLESLDDASAELLTGGLYCFTPSPVASSAAVEASSWLAQVVGADPFFLDVTEHDGLQAGVEGLPDLVSIALLRATVDTPGWEEMRKFAGSSFAAATEGVDEGSDEHVSLFLNRENIFRRLDALIEELRYLRIVLNDADESVWAEISSEAVQSRRRWMAERRQGMWAGDGEAGTRDVPGAGEQMRRMLLGDLGSRRRGTRDESRET